MFYVDADEDDFFASFYDRDSWQGQGQKKPGKSFFEPTDKPLYGQVLWCGRQRRNVWSGFQDRHYGMFDEIVRVPEGMNKCEAMSEEKTFIFGLTPCFTSEWHQGCPRPHSTALYLLASMPINTCMKGLCERKQMLFRLFDRGG